MGAGSSISPFVNIACLHQLPACSFQLLKFMQRFNSMCLIFYNKHTKSRARVRAMPLCIKGRRWLALLHFEFLWIHLWMLVMDHHVSVFMFTSLTVSERIIMFLCLWLHLWMSVMDLYNMMLVVNISFFHKRWFSGDFLKCINISSAVIFA